MKENSVATFQALPLPVSNIAASLPPLAAGTSTMHYQEKIVYKIKNWGRGKFIQIERFMMKFGPGIFLFRNVFFLRIRGANSLGEGGWDAQRPGSPAP